jgi:hypothetical protein
MNEYDYADAMRSFIMDEIDYDIGKEIENGEWESLDYESGKLAWKKLADRFVAHLTATAPVR